MTIPDASQILTAFGQRIRELRHAEGWSQEELAYRSGLHRTYIATLEGGKRNVSLVGIVQLARAFDVNVANMVGNFDVKRPRVRASTGRRP